MQAIACGGCEPNCTPSRADPSGEDGAQESDVDDEVGAPIEDLPGPGPRGILTLRPRQEGWGAILKWTSNDEGNDRGDYAWNWDKPGGGPPWQDIEGAILLVAEKTHLLQNTYIINIK